MGYVGNTPALNYTTFAVQHFTTSATTGYTLDNAVTNENGIALFINNVRQEPGASYAYTASGTTLTLSAATTSSDTMYCVFIGKAVQTVNPGAGSVGTSQLAALGVTNAKIANSTVDLTAKVTGTLPIANGGTNSTSTTYADLTANVTGTLPIANGGTGATTLAGAGLSNTPSFFARASTDQDISSATITKVEFDSEVFDTDSAYDTTNDKFVVPSGKDGKYVFMYAVDCNAKAVSELEIATLYFYKNGAAVSKQLLDFTNNPSQRICVTNSIIMDVSASDYIEVYGAVQDASSTPKFTGDSPYTTYFAGYKLT